MRGDGRACTSLCSTARSASSAGRALRGGGVTAWVAVSMATRRARDGGEQDTVLNALPCCCPFLTHGVPRHGFEGALRAYFSTRPSLSTTCVVMAMPWPTLWV